MLLKNVRKYSDSFDSIFKEFSRDIYGYKPDSLMRKLVSENFVQFITSCDEILHTKLLAQIPNREFHELRMQLRNGFMLLSKQFDDNPTENAPAGKKIIEFTSQLKKLQMIAREYKFSDQPEYSGYQKQLEKSIRNLMDPSSDIDGIFRRYDIDKKLTDLKHSEELTKITTELLNLIRPEKTPTDDDELRKWFNEWRIANHPDKTTRTDLSKDEIRDNWLQGKDLWDKRNKLFGL